MAERRKRRLNQDCFVLPYFTLFAYFELFLVCVLSCTVLFVSINQVIGCEDRPPLKWLRLSRVRRWTLAYSYSNSNNWTIGRRSRVSFLYSKVYRSVVTARHFHFPALYTLTGQVPVFSELLFPLHDISAFSQESVKLEQLLSRRGLAYPCSKTYTALSNVVCKCMSHWLKLKWSILNLSRKGL